MVERPEWGLILGGAANLWADIKALEAMLERPWPGIIVATNNAGVDWDGPMDHWATFHPEKLHWLDETDDSGDWIKKRRERRLSSDYETWGRRAPDLVDHIVEVWGGMSSGGLALNVLHELGCTRAVLCGVPMTMTPHYHDDQSGKDWKHADLHWRSWMRHKQKMDGWVRSMSGRTADTFGIPDLKWLMEGVK
jgi:hypothetical protein